VRPPLARRAHARSIGFSIAAAALLLASLDRGAPISTAEADTSPHAGHGAMSDADMMQMARAAIAAHPSRAARVARTSLAAPADSFTAVNFRFEHDGSAATQVDTVRILPGQSVRFKYGTGVHTVTSGTGSLDPNVGIPFDNQMFSVADNFDWQYDDPGIYQFFCAVHEASNMRGVIFVFSGTGSVQPIGMNVPRIGFVTTPSPNPTRAGVSFRFALAKPGHVRIDVFDLAGRRIATPQDGNLGAGTFAAAWDGQALDGRRVSPGVYAIRLSVPGGSETRRVAVER
jgi:plastocyanin